MALASDWTKDHTVVVGRLSDRNSVSIIAHTHQRVLRITAMQTIHVAEQFALAPLELSDADELFVLTDKDRDYLREWLPWLDSIRRVDDTRAFIRAAQAQAAQNNGAQLAIKIDGHIAGVVGHHQIDWRNRMTSLGYWIGEAYQGHGLVTASCRTLITHAFDEARLNRVEVRCAVENQKSRAIPIRLGLRQEGLLRDAEWLYDHFVDHVVYATLVNEWHTVDPTADATPSETHS